jgi:hypothetical protein
MAERLGGRGVWPAMAADHVRLSAPIRSDPDGAPPQQRGHQVLARFTLSSNRALLFR